jgi:DHA1 family bicyclomycin/chloramphenicol resistance-like MFS transporter
VSMGNVAVIALNFAALFAYVSASSLVLIGLLGISQRAYGLLFAATSGGLMLGAFTNARLSARGVAHSRLIAWGQGALVVTSLILVTLTLAGALRPWLLVPMVILGFIGHGIVRPNAAQSALEPMASIAGVASAVLSGTQMLTGALASALVAALFDGHSAIAMTGMMAACSAASALVYFTIVRPAERRFFGVPTLSQTAEGS